MFNQHDQRLIRDENSVFQLVAVSVLGDREEQQDSFGYRLMDNEGFVIVCDGMGGHEGGSQASTVAVQTFLERYGQDGFGVDRNSGMIATAKVADERVCRLTNTRGERLKAGSTLVAICIEGRRLLWCAAGDSRAYLLRNGELKKLTTDHNYMSVLTEKRDVGLLNQMEFERESTRGEALISFLGVGNLSLIDYAKVPLALQQNDRIIVMSDGLYKCVTEAEIGRILDNFSNLGEALQALEAKAQRNAKSQKIVRDNMTVALINVK